VKFVLYTHFSNLKDFEAGDTVQCRPVALYDHDVALHVELGKVVILTNQTGIYIKRKTTLKIWFKSLFKKRVKSGGK